jgi:UPF0716 protein FxsA
MTDRSFRVRTAFGGFHTSGVLKFRHVKLLLAGWLLSEVLLFALVVREAGLGGALVLGIVTSLIGVTSLRRLGRGAIGTLRTAMGGQAAPEGALLDGVLAALGAFLLIVPGFVSDLVGLALLTPSLRQAMVARFGGSLARVRAPRRPPPPGVIDLDPQEWSVSDPARR